MLLLTMGEYIWLIQFATNCFNLYVPTCAKYHQRMDQTKYEHFEIHPCQICNLRQPSSVYNKKHDIDAWVRTMRQPSLKLNHFRLSQKLFAVFRFCLERTQIRIQIENSVLLVQRSWMLLRRQTINFYRHMSSVLCLLLYANSFQMLSTGNHLILTVT